LPKIIIFPQKLAIENFCGKMKIFANFFSQIASFWQFFDIHNAISRWSALR